MTMEELLRILEMQEEVLQFSHFTNSDAWELGNIIVAEIKKLGLQVVVSIQLNNGYTVFKYAADGTNLHNDFWLTRKFNMVKVKEMSSLRAYALLQAQEKTLDDWFLDPKEYGAFGGGFPIRVEEVGVIGAVVVSGLPHVQDHDLVIKCISKYLHVDAIPRIKGSF